MLLKRRWQIISRFGAKVGVGHRLLGESLQDIDANRAVIRKSHVTIVPYQKCYCLTDRDCTSLASEIESIAVSGA
jgi:hypothetical protein